MRSKRSVARETTGSAQRARYNHEIAFDVHGDRLRDGTSLGRDTLASDGSPQLEYLTVWGINAAGDPYYDAAGAAAGEEAGLSVRDDGAIVLTAIRPS